MRDMRGGGIGMIFQEPATSLNPVLTVGRQIVEALELHSALRGAAARERADELLDQVGIPDPRRRLDEYPFQLSGGMSQRVMIAIALAGVAAPADRRRADHGAGRDHTGAGARPARRPAAQAGHGAAADHARPRRGGAHGGPRRRDVCRATGGGGAARAVLRAAGASLLGAPVRRAARCRTARRPAGDDSRQCAGGGNPPCRLPLCRPLQRSHAGVPQRATAMA